MIKTTPNNPLRKVAILVASLDEQWSNRVLESLPSEQAAIVRQRVDQLVEIDPDEQAVILAEFRSSFTQDSNQKSEGVELNLSSQDHPTESNPQEKKVAVHTLEALSEADTQFIVEMLIGEQPQTIALILSRLDAQQAVDVLGSFSSVDQADIMQRLAELDAIDQESVEVIESQVARWIAEARQRKARIAAGLDVVNRIIEKTPSAQREKLIAELRKKNSVLAFRMDKEQVKSEPPKAIPAKKEHRNSVHAPVKEHRNKPINNLIPIPQRPPSSNPFSNYTMEQSLAALESLEKNRLLNALSQCESHITRLALVGVSEKLLKRVLAGRSRREARQFRQSLREIGPTRISDILAAQQEILFTASKFHN